MLKVPHKMAVEVWSERIFAAVACPRCKAKVGMPCIGRQGETKASPHPRRRDIYLASMPKPTNLPRDAKTEPERQAKLRRQTQAAMDAAREEHACPRCKAKAGLYCISAHGRMMPSIHAARWHVAGANPIGRPKRLAPDERPTLALANPSAQKAMG